MAQSSDKDILIEEIKSWKGFEYARTVMRSQFIFAMDCIIFFILDNESITCRSPQYIISSYHINHSPQQSEEQDR